MNSSGNPGPRSVTWSSTRPFSARASSSHRVRRRGGARCRPGWSAPVRSASRSASIRRSGGVLVRDLRLPARAARSSNRERTAAKRLGDRERRASAASIPPSAARATTSRSSARLIRRSASPIAARIAVRSSSSPLPWRSASSSSSRCRASGVRSSWLASSTNLRSRATAASSRPSISFRVSPRRVSSSPAGGDRAAARPASRPRSRRPAGASPPPAAAPRPAAQ